MIASVNDEISTAQNAETRKAVRERFLLAHAEGKGDPLIDDAAYCETQTFTRACHDAGYFDQSHFIREFRAFVGEPPARFFAQSRVC